MRTSIFRCDVCNAAVESPPTNSQLPPGWATVRVETAWTVVPTKPAHAIANSASKEAHVCSVVCAHTFAAAALGEAFARIPAASAPPIVVADPFSSNDPYR